MRFTIHHHDTGTAARAGELALPRGTVETPAFMPVGTQATVKGLTPRDLEAVGAAIVLGNTYHLMLRPGAKLVRSFGGISGFMAWPRPLLTDSGGYQVFSLADRRVVTPDGVVFRSHIDGSEQALTPEDAVRIQADLNADIIMALDICPPLTASKAEVAQSLATTHAWAARCVAEQARLAAGEDAAPAGLPAGTRWLAPAAQSLFLIVQGGVHLDLRDESREALVALEAPGYAIGGVSVGEGPEAMAAVVKHVAPRLPAGKPRYLMGVGHPRDLLMGIAAGVDLFDCVLPTRNGRNGQALTAAGRVNLRNACHRESRAPLDPECDCYTCRTVSRGYLRHLFQAGEMLASHLTSLHNVRFVLRLMEDARAAIRAGRYAEFARAASSPYRAAGCGGE